ncbi:hypothetical protein [Spirosoma aerolatum]|uniref:hypothetical protein n=1 Tax=Spirosoma aerolatum TaxID=1211326 RepID=UPI0009ABF5B3|nr:hypothetical protein [Spirosoma aerolatum]
MAKQTKKAATVAAELTAARRTTDKTYEQLPLNHEVVVQVGPRQRMQRNKVVTVEEARNVIFTKAGYEAMDRDEETGETTHILTKVLGIPEYKMVEDTTIPDGKRKDFDVLYFADAESETEEEEPAA